MNAFSSPAKQVVSLPRPEVVNFIGASTKPANPRPQPQPAPEPEHDSAVVTTIAGDGTATGDDGVGTNAGFGQPRGIASDSNGTLYVTDAAYGTVRKIATSGIVSTIGGPANFPSNPNPAAAFCFPEGIAVDGNNTVYVADAYCPRIRTVSSAGAVATLAGSGNRGFYDTTGTNAVFDAPIALVVDKQGNVFVSDQDNNCIRKITPGGVVTSLTRHSLGGYVDGTVPNAFFFNPQGIAFDHSGNLFVADHGNDRIRKITPTGVVSTIAGGGPGTITDGQGTKASIAWPYGITVDKKGNLYVTQPFFNRIRRITPEGYVSTFAGSEKAGYKDGPAKTALFNNPMGITIDKSGNLYVADSQNRRIRKITFY